MPKLKYSVRDARTSTRLNPYIGTIPRDARVLGSKTFEVDGKELIFRVSSRGEGLPLYVTITDGWRVKFRVRAEVLKGCKAIVETVTQAVFDNIDKLRQ